MCLGKIFVHVLGSGFGIDSGGGLQRSFASMQNAGDSLYLGSIGGTSQVGVIKVVGRGNDQGNWCLLSGARGCSVEGVRIKGGFAIELR